MTRIVSLGDMQKIAKVRGGNCLSEQYVDMQTKLKWKCSEGHIWMAQPSNVRQGKWCPICAIRRNADRLRGNLEEIRTIAESKGGKCLSDKYITARIKLKFQCSNGHLWETTPERLKKGMWCPTCGILKSANSRRLSINEMQKLAKEKRGLCLSNKYIDNRTKLRWKCEKGHEWEARPSNIKNGNWCPTCAGRNRTIDDFKKIAIVHGGKCLSEKYLNSSTKLKFRCEDGHVWESAPSKIIQGRWCPICSTGISERICRKYFEIIFKEEFPKKYPRWLKNAQGNQMELDGYCKKLKLAFEYHGVQHFKTVKKWHKKKSLNQQRKDDELKRKLCGQRGIALIEVPHTIHYENMAEYILQKCKSYPHINVPKIRKKIDYRLFDVYSPHLMKEMQAIARERGGKCLSKGYISTHTKLEWQCSKGHIWRATPSKIKMGKWCPKCYDLKRGGSQRLSIDEMQAIARERGGKCLSKVYINAITKLEWKCAKGHIWEAIPASIKVGRWCPICAIKKVADLKRLPIEKMHELAKAKGGECLSDVYINSQTKIKWKCNKGHIWNATPSDIKNGNWCPFCSGRRQTIKDMHKIAKIRGGNCISKKYLGTHKKHKWVCDMGHVWEATPANIKRGTWCPICSKMKKGSFQKLTIEEMFLIAENRGGKCISKEYINVKTKLKWQCSKGHEWYAIPDNIKRGRWCPVCAKDKTQSIC
ncbi:zinc-ribbon domain-containing protein [Candidatus Woesearchaeota archaeon]|nr:zinc-ribbon domain-containing protein [Candidatus Woesearchaeota archaeon]